MNALRNAVHLVSVLIWAALGVLFSVKAIFVAGAFLPVLVFWAWLACFVGATTALVRRFNSPLGALVVHGGAFLALNLIPHVFPLSLLRIGYDLLGGMPLPFR